MSRFIYDFISRFDVASKHDIQQNEPSKTINELSLKRNDFVVLFGISFYQDVFYYSKIAVWTSPLELYKSFQSCFTNQMNEALRVISF